jgi:type VI protein secretion system component VasF
MHTGNRNSIQSLQTAQTAPMDISERDEHFLPPRKAVHPAEKERWSKLFYRSLLWMFILLVVGLLVWGRQFMWHDV